MGVNENVKAVYDRIQEEHWKQDCENPQPPVMKDGVHLDRQFAENIKKVWVWKSDGTPDYQKTLALRELMYRGYENQKSAKPGRNLAPVPEEEIEAAIEKIANPEPKKVVDNRFVHE